MDWTPLSQSVLYKGFFELLGIELKHELFAGGQSPVIHRELLVRNNVSAVLPYDPERDELVLIEQFRVGARERQAGPWTTEIIAGYQEHGESPEDVAIRESMEEAGCSVTELRPMMDYFASPGISTERIHMFLGRASTEGVEGIHGLAHEGEDIRVDVVSPATAFEWLENGKIDTALSVIAVQWFQQHYDEVRQNWAE